MGKVFKVGEIWKSHWAGLMMLITKRRLLPLTRFTTHGQLQFYDKNIGKSGGWVRRG